MTPAGDVGGPVYLAARDVHYQGRRAGAGRGEPQELGDAGPRPGRGRGARRGRVLRRRAPAGHRRARRAADRAAAGELLARLVADVDAAVAAAGYLGGGTQTHRATSTTWSFPSTDVPARVLVLAARAVADGLNPGGWIVTADDYP